MFSLGVDRPASLLVGAAHLFPLPLPGLPPVAVMVRQGARATAAYGAGDFGTCFSFRWQETRSYILPLLIGSLPRISALCLAGSSTWRLGWLGPAPRCGRLYLSVAVMGLLVGGEATVVEMFGPPAGAGAQPWRQALTSLTSVPLAFGYISLFFKATLDPAWMRRFRVFAPAGRMALTNYLSQSVVLGFVFFGYGLGLMGRVSSSHAAAGGIAFYALQVAGSRFWLSRFRFGPVEWAWRRLTFGHAPPAVERSVR